MRPATVPAARFALELAAAGLAASATALSPAGFFTAAERRRALPNGLMPGCRKLATSSCPAAVTSR